MAVSKRLRYEVLQRDDFSCHYCHRDDVRLTVDHVIPIALGGADKASNLVAACVECNAGKSSINPDGEVVEKVDEDAERWAGAMQRAAEVRATQFEHQHALVSAFDAVWEEGVPATGYLPTRPSDWADSILRFQTAGLPVSTVLNLAQTALRSSKVYGSGNHWRYFCGCCWNEIRAIQDLATEMLSEETS